MKKKFSPNPKSDNSDLPATEFIKTFCKTSFQNTKGSACRSSKLPWSSRASPRASLLVPSSWIFLSSAEKITLRNYWLELKPSERSKLVFSEKSHILALFSKYLALSCSCQFCSRRKAVVEEEIIILYDSYALELEIFCANIISVKDFHRHQQPTLSELFMTYEDVNDDELLFKNRDFHSENKRDIGNEFYPAEYKHPTSATSFFNLHSTLPQPRLTRELAFRSALMSIAGDIISSDGRRFIGLFEKLAETRIFYEEGLFNPHRVQPNTKMLSPINVSPHETLQKEEDSFRMPYVYNTQEDSFFEDTEDSEENDEDFNYDTDNEESFFTGCDVLNVDCHTSCGADIKNPQIEEGRRIFQVVAAKAFEQRVVTAYRAVLAMTRLGALAIEEEQEIAKQEAKQMTQKLVRQKKRQAKKGKKKNSASGSHLLVPDELVSTGIIDISEDISTNATNNSNNRDGNDYTDLNTDIECRVIEFSEPPISNIISTDCENNTFLSNNKKAISINSKESKAKNSSYDDIGLKSNSIQSPINYVQPRIKFKPQKEKGKNKSFDKLAIPPSLQNDDFVIPSGHLDIDDILSITPPQLCSTLLSDQCKPRNQLRKPTIPVPPGFSPCKINQSMSIPPGF